MIANTLDLCEQVGYWSRKNFRDQNRLREAAPLMGAAEELLFELANANRPADRFDAYADAIIFLMDFAFRADFPDSTLQVVDQELKRFPTDLYFIELLVKYDAPMQLGQLFRINLKSRQGIRGYSGPVGHCAEAQDAFQKLIVAIVAQYSDEPSVVGSLFSLTVHTWEDIVSKRDWRRTAE